MATVKLKRFLLRYDPPGIGLEVADDSGEPQVFHKNLPDASAVTKISDIHSVVDDLINEESLLTKRRHRAALISLLGRLYQVEIPATDDEAGKASAEAANTARSQEPEEGVVEGQQVVLVMLKGKQQIHNGEIVVVVKAKRDKEKYEVQLPQGKTTSEGSDILKVKGVEHMIPISKGTPLAVGTHVAIRGLRNHIELNGCLGRVVECHEESHRFEVRAAESGQLFRVKQENLIPIEGIPASVGASKENREPNTQVAASSSSATGLADNSNMQGDQMKDGESDVFEIGSTVQLFGLKTAMNYNGQHAEVLSVDRVRCRYEIRLNDGSVKTIRAENVRFISPPANKSSPRTRRDKGVAKAPKP